MMRTVFPLRRTCAALWRGCSLRNFAALLCGGVPVGAPGAAGPATGAPVMSETPIRAVVWRNWLSPFSVIGAKFTSFVVSPMPPELQAPR